MNPEQLEKLNGLAEGVGSFIEYWGFKKIHGKIWTHLYTSSEPLDAADLMKRLGVSKSLVSITLNDLLKYEVILQKGKGPRDTQVYTANPQVREVVLNVLKNRESKLLGKISDQFSGFINDLEVSSSQRVCPNKVKCLGNMISQANSALTAMLSLGEVDFKKIDFS